MAESGLVVDVDNFEQIIFDSRLTCFQFIEHIGQNFIIVFSVGLDSGQRKAIGDGDRFGVRQMPLKFMGGVG